MDTTRQLKCWAAHVGSCSEKISREHLISRSILPSPTVLVEGFNWCKEPVRIGIDALTAKILCARHNNALSTADELIAKFSDAANFQTTDIAISGRLLERWFLKTLVNLSIGTKDHIGEGISESQAGWPAPYLAAVTFGSTPLTHTMGLYTLNCQEPYKYRRGEILFVPLTRNNYIGGALFGVAGMYFFLSLRPGFAPTSIGNMAPSSDLPSHVLGATMTHRPTWLEFASRHGNIARIDIDWAAA